jgi:hypothetical protein
MGAVKNHRRRSSLSRVFEDLIEAEWQRMKNPPPGREEGAAGQRREGFWGERPRA